MNYMTPKPGVDPTDISDHVDILMSTYNGSRYLTEQIESIIRQDHQNWTLIVRDDGSSDTTVDILQKFASRDGRITIVADDGKNVGPAISFMRLLAQSSSPYFLFADQDDIWLPSKITLTLSGMKRSEKDSGIPLLVFTDLQVVGENLELISPSFLKFQRLNPEKFKFFRRELLQNIVTGCAMGGNAALRRKGIAVLQGQAELIIMHDWWLVLVAHYFGTVSFIPEAPILYRQHACNQLGAKGSGFSRYLEIAKSPETFQRIERYLNRISQQNKLFHDTYAKQIRKSDADLLMLIAGLENRWTATGLIKCLVSGAGFKTIDCCLGVFCVLLVRTCLRACGWDDKCESRL